MPLFYNKTLREISTRTWSIYLVDGKPNKHVFVFTPSVGVEHFLVHLNGRNFWVDLRALSYNIRLLTASGTSASHIHFDFSVATQACPHTYIGSSIATEA